MHSLAVLTKRKMPQAVDAPGSVRAVVIAAGKIVHSDSRYGVVSASACSMPRDAPPPPANRSMMVMSLLCFLGCCSRLFPPPFPAPEQGRCEGRSLPRLVQVRLPPCLEHLIQHPTGLAGTLGGGFVALLAPGEDVDLLRLSLLDDLTDERLFRLQLFGHGGFLAVDG